MLHGMAGSGIDHDLKWACVQVRSRQHCHTMIMSSRHHLKWAFRTVQGTAEWLRTAEPRSELL
jgi:hypothetical protein